MDATVTERGRWRQRGLGWLTPWCVLAVGCGLSWMSSRLLEQTEERVVQASFDAEAQERETLIRRALAEAAAVVHDLESSIGAAGPSTRARFSNYATAVLARHGGIRALSWNVVVEGADRARHEDQMTAGGRDGYRIVERDVDGRLVRAAPRDRYVVVCDIEPFAGNELAFGFDVASEHQRRGALERAGRTGEFSATPLLALVQDTDRRARPSAVLGFVPSFEDAGQASALDSFDVPQPRIAGFAAGAFDVAVLLDRALAPLEPTSLDIVIVDVTDPERVEMVYSRRAGDEHGVAGPAMMRLQSGDIGRSGTFDWGGRSWRLSIFPQQPFFDAHRTRLPVFAFVIGVLFSCLIASYLTVLGDRRRRIEREVELRRQVEARLREREERLVLTLDAVADGGWDWNVATGEMQFSDRWLASLGLSRAEAPTDVAAWEARVHPDDVGRLREAAAAHVDGRAPAHECEIRLRDGSGEYRWHMTRGKIVARDGDGKPRRIIGADTDITARKRDEDQRREYERHAQDGQKLESLGLLAGGIAHDFNNLLVGVLGNVELALADAPGSRHLREIRIAAARAAELTRQMLAYTGQASFERRNIDVTTLVEEMAHLLEAAISKKVAVRYEFSAEVATVEGDPTQLRQVVMNLITNGSDAIGDGTGTVTLRTDVVDLRDGAAGVSAAEPVGPGRYVVVEVADTGVGMDEATAARIFEPFFTTKRRGRGLGLAAVLGIVRAHGGTLQVDTAPGRGSCFSVLLPFSAPHPVGDEIPGERDLDWSGPATVLVVDDEASVRSLIATVLESRGVTVVLARDGVEGIEALREHGDAIDAVVLDATMPRMGGEEAFVEMRRMFPELGILLTSGFTEFGSFDRILELGFAGFLQKPFHVRDLVGQVRRVVERRRRVGG